MSKPVVVSKKPWSLRAVVALSCLICAAFNAGAQAQPIAPVSVGFATVGKPVSLRGPTTSKQPFDLDKLRGKVALLFFWSTDCPVCLSKLPELRRNLSGWRGKDFVIVAVNQDRKLSDLMAYEQVLRRAVPGDAELNRQMQMLWRKDAAYRDNLGHFPVRVSTTVVVGRDGKVITSVQGRVPNEVWDDIAAELVSN